MINLELLKKIYLISLFLRQTEFLNFF